MSIWRGSKGWRYLVNFFLVLALALICLQIWSAVSTYRMFSSAQKAGGVDKKEDIEREKTRQELIAKIIENASKGGIQNNLVTGLGALTAALVTIVGAMLTLRGYLDAREKERLDRLGNTLNETLTRLVAAEPRQRVVGAAGLLPFFTPEREDFHLQALSPLIAAARMDDEQSEVRQGIRIALEQAARTVKQSVLAQVSWQGAILPSINLAGIDLHGLDLRDATLENAKLTGARLDGADLTAAKLQGAHLDEASLTGANLTYADLAGASLARAHLRNAKIDGIKVLNLDLDGADFTGVASGWRGVPWDSTRNWRQAKFDADARQELDRQYGKAAPPCRVLMLMWEVPPMVAGGTWTACYHLVRNLRRRGADVTVVVPWDLDTILNAPFGSEVPVVSLGIVPPDEGSSPYGWSPYGGSTPSWSPYSSSARPSYYGGWSPYGGSAPSWSPYSRSAAPSDYGWSPYGGGNAPFWSTYINRPGGASQGYGPQGYGSQGYGPSSVYGSYTGRRYSGGSYGAAGGSLSGSILFRLIGDFRRRLEVWVRDHPADLIHAHDWVTFDAAQAAAKQSALPWIAHFHSTEGDRQPDRADPLIERIEQDAVNTATQMVTPSETTRQRLIAAYHAAAERIDVVPNSLSAGEAPTSDMGRFETRRVVFLGRLSPQKGVDRFCAVADAVRAAGVSARFEVFGDGEDRQMLGAHGVAWNGPVGWDERSRAFRGASAILVPSRSEPFGMVILEAMQHRVPVIYPIESGAAEVLQSGIKIAAENTAAMAEQVKRLLGSIDAWEGVVRAEAREIEKYPDRGFEDLLIAVWMHAIRPVIRN